jgi:hypothetical protein
MRINRLVVAAAIALAALAGAYWYLTERSTDGAGSRSSNVASATVRDASPSPGACRSSVRNVMDGPDPWGGCFPGPSNTGVPSGTVLTDYTGPCSITVANTIIDSKRVNCPLEIRAKNVHIRDSLVNGHVWIDDPDPDYSFTVTDSTVDAGPVDSRHNDGNRAIGNSHFTAIRVETVRGISGVFCEYDCTVRDSWIHGQDKDESGLSHMSGIRLGSGPTPESGQSIVHNTIRCDAPDVPPDAGCSADITGYGDFAPIRNNLIKRNLLQWTTGGACAYGGSGNGAKPYDFDAKNNRWIDNIFERGPGNRGSGAQGRCGYWFAITSFDRNAPGNLWQNNRWDSGEVMPSDG